MTISTILRPLHDALREADPDRIDAAVDVLAASLAIADADAATVVAHAALKDLRSSRCYRGMLRIAEGTFKAGSRSPQVIRQYAQALIEEGLLTAALQTLLPLRGQAGPEKAEVEGLIGRAWKQRYLDSPESSTAGTSLQSAVEAYLGPYLGDPDEHHWHGVNAMALLVRAERDGAPLRTDVHWREIAEQLISSVAGAQREKNDVWAAANVAEAHVALGNFESAAEWLARWTSTTNDAFAFAGTLRQLRQVWRIDESDTKQRALVDLLEARLLEAGGGRLDVAPTRRAKQIDQDDPYLQRVFGKDQYQTITWYRAGLEAAKSVVRIKRPLGRTEGTGFVLHGSYLREDWQELVVITNFHVVNRDGVHPGFAPQEVRVAFEDSTEDVPIQDVLWESPNAPVGSNPPASLDTTVLRLASAPPAAPFYGPARRPPRHMDERVYVIGHPLGQELAFSLNDNRLVGATDVVLHYRSPTQPGSSGSPLFDRSWGLLGIHHGGNEKMPRLDDGHSTYEANEGFLLSAVQSLINQSGG
ncbi:MAG: serine protease [Actinomycetota bacterium]|nr:serine protease [Actinomycetota bacterium]